MNNYFATLRRSALPLAAAALSCLALLATTSWAEDASTGAPVEVESVVLRLIAEAEVPAQEAGVLTSVAVREGQSVKQGDLLAQVDDQAARLAQRDAELAYKAAHAQASNDVRLRFAKKSLEVSEAELRRSTESVERFAKSISQSQIDVERLTVQKNRLEAEQATHEQQLATIEMQAKKSLLAAAEAQLARRKIAAPLDGVVVQIFVRQGEWVEPGQKALRIVDVSRLKAEGFIPAETAANDLVGAPVRLTVDLAGEQQAAFAGQIAFVSPEVDPITGQVRVWAEIDNRAGRLRPGQPVRMTIGATRTAAISQSRP